MAPPKSSEPKPPPAEKSVDAAEVMGPVSTKSELKKYLQRIRDRMGEEVAAPIFAMAALNQILCMPTIYTLLDNENKEIARDIWLRLKKSGMQLRNPPMLFAADELNGVGA